ncbi:haloalkane dehalogenase [Zhongshania borealis]|uniref:Haloalkane dehalogenase n=1 Tax=Zhongshania borealis TaxID=889488 RepID=A0ABP7WRP7_9GAMM
MVSENMLFNKKYVRINGKKIAYIDEGVGEPIVLLHGNPASSYLWRNVIPVLKTSGRVVVPDLIGHGDSDKLLVSEGDDRYSFESAYQYLDGFLAELGIISNVILVIHDWGSGLGFHWAKMHPHAIRGIAYMEAIVMPLTWEDWPAAARSIFQGFRSGSGEDLILNRNLFIESVLPNSILRELTKTEMDQYRAPFNTPEARQPMLSWPRQLPIEGEPADVVAKVLEYSEFMSKSEIPKLFINADPGSILVGRQRDFCRIWPKQKEVTVKGLHFIQEDSPVEIGTAVVEWIDML